LKPFKFAYLTHRQLAQKRTFQRQQRNVVEVEKYSQSRILPNTMSRVDTYKRVGVCIADNKINRVKSILSRCLNEKRGLKCVIETLSYATKNMYAAKQYHQDDYDSGILMLKLGGRALCHVYSKFGGGPCMNTIKAISDMPGYYLTYSSEIDREMMEKNYNIFLFCRISASKKIPGNVCTA
jgi:hypothetical protein